MNAHRSSLGKSARRPTYSFHKATGQARVWLNGKSIYLGKYDSPESHQKYWRLIADEGRSPGPNGTTVPKPIQIPKDVHEDQVTIKLLAVEYTKHATRYYVKNGKPTSELTSVKTAMKHLLKLYGSLPAQEFGSIRFQNYRDYLIDRRLARATINHYMHHVKRMFRKAHNDERIPLDWYLRINAVENVQEGRLGVKPTEDVLPVDDAIVDATLEELTPILADMVKLQKLSGMRPGELLQLKPCDVDRSLDIWTYKPNRHKNQHKKTRKSKIRVVVMGPLAQEILAPYLLRDHQDYCFQPAEVYAQHQELRHENRQTPMNEGNKPTGSTRLKFHVCYDAGSYRTAIKRAAKRAHKTAVKNKTADHKEFQKSAFNWAPNQLRHSAATLARKEQDLETAQIICGHSRKTTTENVYAEIDLSLAIEFARKFG